MVGWIPHMLHRAESTGYGVLEIFRDRHYVPTGRGLSVCFVSTYIGSLRDQVISALFSRSLFCFSEALT